MITNIDQIVGLASSYRLCWICGRFGGHKTSFAYALSEYFLRDGYRLISTNRSVWADDIRNISLIDGKLHAVVLLDEGGLYLKSSVQLETFFAYLAKMDVIVLIPSFYPPVRSAQVFTIQPVFSFLAVGLPLVVYRWRVRLGGFVDVGYFFWLYPQSIYGIYSRNDPSDSPDAVLDALYSWTSDYKRYYGRESVSHCLSDMANKEAQLADSVSSLADAAESLETLFRRKGKWR